MLQDRPEGNPFRNWTLSLEQVSRAMVPITPDMSAQISRAMNPDMTGLYERISRAMNPVTPDMSAQISRAMNPDMTAISEQVIQAVTPDLSTLVEQISSWTKSIQALQLRVTPTPAFDWMCRAAASAILEDAAPEQVRNEPRWRVAVNEWLEKNAVALFLWLAAGVITVVFCVATAMTPDFVEQVNTALATPGIVIGIGLAVWSLNRKNGNEPSQ